jgi:hypothetical protein
MTRLIQLLRTAWRSLLALDDRTAVRERRHVALK